MSLPAVPMLMPTEPPTSYLSRLAFLNGLTARQLCREFRLDFQGIVDGDLEAVGELADLAGVPEKDLMKFAFIRREGFDYEHQGEMFVRDLLRRRHIMVCPECLRADIAANTDPDRDSGTVVYNRADWCIDAVVTCAIHRLGLIEVANADNYEVRHDFVQLVSPSLPRLEVLSRQALRRPPTVLEQYVSKRLAKQSAPIGFLDTLDLHVAITVCVVVGAMKLYGRTVDFDRLDAERRRLAGDTGFQVLRNGEEGFLGFLRDIHHEFSLLRRGGLYGPAAAIGSLFKLLRMRQDREYRRHASFAPVRAFVVNFALDHFAMHPGDKILGVKIEERRLHSVRSLSEATGLNPHRLKKVLYEHGVINERQMGYSFHQIAFDAQASLDAVNLEMQSVGIPGAAKHMGCTPAEATRLAKDGFIRPVIMPAKSKVVPRYAIAHLDAFIGELLQNATPVARPKENQVGMQKASRQARRPTAEIIRHVLQGNIKNTFRLTGKRGYGALLVDIAEVQRLVRDPEHGGLRIRETTVAICTSEFVARALMQQGHIKTTVVKNPATRQEQIVVMPAEVEAFRKKYISAWLLARERGMHPASVRRAMERAEVKPAFNPHKIGGWIYRREDVPASLGT
jgi:hypothetical protein